MVPSGLRTWATVSCLARRKVSAWAFPRPSATASAKLANSTVAHNHTVIDPTKRPGLTRKATEVTRLPTSTTNMTGLRTMWRGSSFTNASMKARRRIPGSSIEVPARRRTLGGRVSGGGATATAPPESSGSSITTGTVARLWGPEPSVCRSARARFHVRGNTPDGIGYSRDRYDLKGNFDAVLAPKPTALLTRPETGTAAGPGAPPGTAQGVGPPRPPSGVSPSGTKRSPVSGSVMK